MVDIQSAVAEIRRGKKKEEEAEETTAAKYVKCNKQYTQKKTGCLGRRSKRSKKNMVNYPPA